MRWIKCQNCGKIVQVDEEEAFCPECHAELAKKSTLAERVCWECGRTFVGGPRAWYCPECRAERRKEATRRYRSNGAQRKLGSIGHCEICGKEYIVASGQQRYCKECAENAVKEIDRAQTREWREVNREWLSKQDKERKACAVCGKQISTGSPEVTCSEECARVLKSYNMAVADFKRGKRKDAPDIVVLAVQAGIDVRDRFENPSGHVKDLTGKKFGELTAIGYTGENIRGRGAIWWCLCSCGNLCKKSANALTQGKATSCGHDKRPGPKRGTHINDISGMRFGELTVIKATDKRENGSVVWECKCSCGKICYVSARNLKNGSVKSCGHLKRGKRIYMNWIKVTPETMPPNGEPVIVTVEDVKSKKRCIDFDVAWSRKLGEWIMIDFGSEPPKTAPIKEAGLRVTHWMLYPNPAED